MAVPIAYRHVEEPVSRALAPPPRVALPPRRRARDDDPYSHRDVRVHDHYAGGVIGVDIADPANPVEVARYDTTPEQDEANFTGTWGATVPSPAGYVYGSDLNGRLTVLSCHQPEG